MMPWELLPYLSAPAMTYTNLTANVGGQVLPADPNRVITIFTNNTVAAFTVSVDSSINNTTKPGINLPSSQPTLPLNYWTHGPLVCAAWYALSGNTATIAVLTQSLNDAVGGMDKVTQLIQQHRRIVPAKPVRGMLADYWHKLTGRG